MAPFLQEMRNKHFPAQVPDPKIHTVYVTKLVKDCPAPTTTTFASMSSAELLPRVFYTVIFHAAAAYLIFEVLSFIYFYFFDDIIASAKRRREKAVKNVKTEILRVKREDRENIKDWFLDSIDEIDVQEELPVNAEIFVLRKMKAVGVWLWKVSGLSPWDREEEKGYGGKRDDGKWEVVQEEKEKITVELSEGEWKLIQKARGKNVKKSWLS